MNPFKNKLLPALKNGGFKMEDKMIWCGSVVKGEDNRYHMFASMWDKSLGFGANWLYNCKIVRASSDKACGPYNFEEIVLDRRGREYFDGLNVHNPYIQKYDGKYYLYYMGTSFGGEIPCNDQSRERFIEVWNNKRIGLAVADSVFGPWKRCDKPILMPRDYRFWDCTITTNPAVTILEDGTTYMLYKSRTYANATLQIGVAKADKPDGKFKRISNDPIFRFDNPSLHVEDPFLWHQDGLFHLVIKDDFKDNSGGITGEWGAGLYATSEDCINWTIDNDPKVYSRKVKWDDGSVTTQPNLERPFLLIEDGKPTHFFFATGEGEGPYRLSHSYNICIPLDI